MTHYWRIRKFLPERYRHKCRVIVYGKNRNVLIEFEDGQRVRTLLTNIRRLESK
jgi:hypothetical protein